MRSAIGRSATGVGGVEVFEGVGDGGEVVVEPADEAEGLGGVAFDDVVHERGALSLDADAGAEDFAALGLHLVLAPPILERVADGLDGKTFEPGMVHGSALGSRRPPNGSPSIWWRSTMGESATMGSRSESIQRRNWKRCWVVRSLRS